MTKKNKLVKIESKTPQPEGAEAVEVQSLIARAIDKNLPVETMEKLLAMRQQLKAEWAREQYHAALAAFQSECPIIKKTKIVKNKDGSERFRYAPLDSIVTQVKDLLREHGFNYTVDAKIEGITVFALCKLTHRCGHSESSGFVVPIDKDAYMSEPQKFASALTFAKRYAFVDVTGILTADEDNADTVPLGPSVGHRRTKPYEEETGAGDPKVQSDLAELKAFLAQNKIPDGFLLALLVEKKMIEPTTTIDSLKPGVLRRCLDPKTKANLVKAWTAQRSADKAVAKQAAAVKGARKTAAPESTYDGDPHPFNRGEVRTNEGDQRRGSRQPIIADIAPKDVLEQEDIDNWRKVKIHFGDKAGTPLGKLSRSSLLWWCENWKPKPFKGTWQEKDLLLDAALVLANAEMEAGE